MKLGEKQVLTIEKQVDFGVYLGTEEEHVLLPKKQVPKGAELGDPVEVFLYKDSRDRLIATTNEPKLTLGELAVLGSDRYRKERRIPRLGTGKGSLPSIQGADRTGEKGRSRSGKPLH